MAQESGGQLPGSDTAAVVRDPDEAHAAPLDLHHHCRGAGVNGVFHQFLDHAGRALHHLAGGDQVRHMRFELLNVRHAASPFREGIRYISVTARMGMVTMDMTVVKKVT